jgi:hypothetical protein
LGVLADELRQGAISQRRQINKFLFSTMPKHCKGHWSACFPQKPKFKSMKVKDVFAIWNIGDPYIKGDLGKAKKV